MEIKYVVILCVLTSLGGYVLYPIIQKYKENRGKAKWRE